MKIPQRLIDCLNESKIGYETLHHPEAVTAQRIAQAEHVKGRHHAKVVMIKSGEQHVMIVLPADHQIDLEKAAKAIGQGVSLDTEPGIQVPIPGLRGWSHAAVWQSLRCANLCGQEFVRARLHRFRSWHSYGRY